jgi:hypothetical protein
MLERSGGPGSAAFDAVVDLGSVDANETDALLFAASKTDVDGVAVDDLDDGPPLPQFKDVVVMSRDGLEARNCLASTAPLLR